MKQKLLFKMTNENGIVKYFINDKEVSKDTFDKLYNEDMAFDFEAPDEDNIYVPMTEYDEQLLNVIDVLRTADDDEAIDLLRQNLEVTGKINYLAGQKEILVQIRRELGATICDIEDEMESLNSQVDYRNDGEDDEDE